MSLYTAIVICIIFNALVMSVFIAKNPMVGRQMQKCFTKGFLLISVVVVAEWLTLFLNNAPEDFRFFHYVVKLIEFSCVPVVPVVFISAFAKNRGVKSMRIILLLHVVAEILAAPFGLIFYMDAANVYTRGPLYFAYVIFYVAMTVLMVLEVARYAKGFQNNNYVLMALDCLFLLSGIVIQLFDSSLRISWLCGEMTLTLAYIYVTDLNLQTDSQTGLLNRFCYEKRIASVNYDSVVVFFDVDSFKSINDTFGHAVGDEVLGLVASCIYKNFAKEAKCYRIGGDEFCAVFKRTSKYSVEQSDERIGALIDRFEMEIRDIGKEDPRFTGVSVGYSFVNKEFEINWAVEYADRKMYECKKRNKDTD